MTNTPNQTTASPAKEEKSLMSKIGGGFSWWIGSLTGHPQAAKVPNIINSTPTQSSSATTAPVPVTTPSASTPKPDAAAGKNEDSVLQDVVAIKNLIDKVSGGVVAKVAPGLKIGAASTSKAASGLVTRVGPSFITKVLKIFFVVLLLIVLAFVGYKLMNTAQKEEEETNQPGTIEDITPTPVVYNPPKASVYATDESILKLEEDINVITQEIGSIVLREGQLTPPTLDFNVNF